jgi:hypothetical protein
MHGAYGLLRFKPVFKVPSAGPAAFFIQIIRRLFYLLMQLRIPVIVSTHSGVVFPPFPV